MLSSSTNWPLHRGIGVVLGVVRGVVTGDVNIERLVGLITPLNPLTGLMLGYENNYKKKIHKSHYKWMPIQFNPIYKQFSLVNQYFSLKKLSKMI